MVFILFCLSCFFLYAHNRNKTNSSKFLFHLYLSEYGAGAVNGPEWTAAARRRAPALLALALHVAAAPAAAARAAPAAPTAPTAPAAAARAAPAALAALAQTARTFQLPGS